MLAGPETSTSITAGGCHLSSVKITGKKKRETVINRPRFFISAAY